LIGPSLKIPTDPLPELDTDVPARTNMLPLPLIDNTPVSSSPFALTFMPVASYEAAAELLAPVILLLPYRTIFKLPALYIAAQSASSGSDAEPVIVALVNVSVRVLAS